MQIVANTRWERVRRAARNARARAFLFGLSLVALVVAGSAGQRWE